MTWAKQALHLALAVRFLEPALVNGAVGLRVAPRGRLFSRRPVLDDAQKIAAVEVVADPERLRKLAVLDDEA